MRHIVLVGLMGAGKTSIGKRVAKRIGAPFVDSDVELERKTGHTARELAARDGVEALHAQEADVVMSALAAPEITVIGAPASIVLTPAMRQRLKQEFVIWLDADPELLEERIENSHKENRPFVDQDPGVLRRQYEERKDLFREVATIVVDTGRRDKDTIADEIVAATRADRAGAS